MSAESAAGRSTIGLACAGGVIEGAIYEVGALCALDEAIDGADLPDLDMYVGVSSGALIAGMLANGVAPRELSRGVVSESEDDSLNLEPEVLFRPAMGEYVGRLRKLPGKVLSSLSYYLRNPGDLSLFGLFSTFGSVLPTGLFNNASLERFLADALATGGRTNDFRELGSQLFVVTMDLDSADVTVFGEAGRAQIPISLAIQASTALPGLYTPVEVNGRYYIDGVARRTVHASVALDAGADLLFCINPIVPVRVQLEGHANRLLNGEAPAYSQSLAERGLPSVLSQTFRAIVDSRKRTGFKKYEHTHPNADLILIEPECDDTSMFFSNIFSFKKRHEVCEHAYRATRAHLRDRASEIAPVLGRHGLSLDLEVLNDRERTLYDAPLPKRVAEETMNSAGSMSEVLGETRDVLDRVDTILDRLHNEQASTGRNLG